MTPEDFERIGNQALVSIAAGHDCMWQGDLLEPHLWEALRIELQRRYRRSTGETTAVLTIENAPDAKMNLVRHRKRGSLYEVIGVGKMQSEDWRDCISGSSNAPLVDMREVTIYRAIDDGSLWVRPRHEFEDGRFEATAMEDVRYSHPAPGDRGDGRSENNEGDTLEGVVVRDDGSRGAAEDGR